MKTINVSKRTWGRIGTHLFALVAVQLVLVLGLIVFAGFQDFRSARATAARDVGDTARRAAEWLQTKLDEQRSQVDQIPQYGDLLTSPGVCAFTGPDAQEQWNSEGLASRFYLNHLDGSPLCPSKDPRETPNFARADWFRQATTGVPVQDLAFVDPVTHHDLLMYAALIPQQDAVVSFSIDLSSVGPTLLQRFGKSTPVPSFVMTTKDRSREISSSNGRSGRSVAGTPYATTIASDNRTFKDLDGVSRINAEATVQPYGWRLVAGVKTSDALAAARSALRSRSVLAGVILVVMLGVAFVLQRRLVRPIRSLARATRRIADGDLDAKATPAGPVELAELADSFNRMADVRAKAEAALIKAYKTEQKAADDLREVDEMRQAFLMAISHELRTPLTSVVGFASFLQEARGEMSEADVDRSIDAIAGQSKRLERLLLDLLDVERLSRGIVEPNLQDTDVRDVVMRAIDRSSGGSRISAPISKPVPAVVDPALVERIIENLVNNAVKHTPPDTRIWVKATRRNGEVCLTVEDDGPGVPDDLKTAVFEPFKQGDVPSHAPGTGVGLSLVARFAKLHGGRAWVDDRRGGGAAFHVVIPAKPHDVKRRASRREKLKQAA